MYGAQEVPEAVHLGGLLLASFEIDRGSRDGLMFGMGLLALNQVAGRCPPHFGGHRGTPANRQGAPDSWPGRSSKSCTQRPSNPPLAAVYHAPVSQFPAS